jgi:ABC-type polysaccharide/polyol phosphate export permease
MGSTLGLSWAVLQPLLLVLLYWFVFTTMVRVGVGGGEHYVEFLVAGLLPWFAFNEGIIRSTTSVIDNAPLVRKLPLKMQLLVLVPNASALVFEIIGLIIFVLFLSARGFFPRSIWLLPVAIALQFALQAGVGLVLATAQVFFRDVTHVVGFILSIVFYLSPILYPVSGRFEKIFAWNPLTPILGLYRRALLSDVPLATPLAPLPGAASIVLVTAVAVVGFAAGSTLMRRAQSELVDLL